MQFMSYLEQQGLTKYKAAKQLEVNYVTLWRWTMGHGRPSARLMLRIAEWSHGAVTPNDWVLAAAGA